MRMPDAGFPVEVIRGVPVVATPEDVDITNAAGLRAALLQSAALGPGTLGGRHDPDAVLRHGRAASTGGRA